MSIASQFCFCNMFLFLLLQSVAPKIARLVNIFPISLWPLWFMIEGSLEVKHNMDRWKSRGGKSQRGEEPKREDQRRERVRRKKMQVREKVGKSRNTVFFQWFVAPGGKVGLLKRRARSHVVRWDTKSCTPLWREANFRECAPLWREARFQIKTYKAHHFRTTFGSWVVEKVHAIVVWSIFPSQNVQSTPCSDHFWKLSEMSKTCRHCGAKHISKSKCAKHTMLGPLLEVEWDVEKVPSLWCEAHFEVKSVKADGFGAPLGVQMSFCVAGARDYAPCQKWEKREGL